MNGYKNMLFKTVEQNVEKWGPSKTLKIISLNIILSFANIVICAHMIPNDSDIEKIEKENECYE